MKLLTTWMCRAHCHRLIKLSGTIGKVSPEKELVENVHGVRETFLDVGREVARRIQQQNSTGVWTFVGTEPEPDPVFGAEASPTIYFLGKLLLSKGLYSLMELLKYAEETADLRVKVDMYGGGADQTTAEAKAEKLGLDMPFHGPLDHAELAYSHKVGREQSPCRRRVVSLSIVILCRRSS
jgi:digalactosyldiacylglycerol synthase